MTQNQTDRSVVLVNLKIQWWRGQRKVRNASVQVSGEEVAESNVTNPRWKLLPDKWHKRFSSIESELRGLLRRFSLPFPIDGISAVAATKAVEYFNLTDMLIKTQFATAVEEFVSQWDEIVQSIQNAYTEHQFREIREYLPKSEAALRECFLAKRYVLPLSHGENKLSGEEAVQYASEIVREVQSLVKETAKVIASSMEEELKQAVSTLTERIDTKGVVKESNLTAVKLALEKMESFGFVTSPEVKEKIRSARNLLEVGHKDLNDDNRKGSRDVASGLVKTLRLFVEDVKNAEVFNQRPKRSVEI
jgi:hypothetical protein